MTTLTTATARKKLTARGAPYFVPTEKPGTAIGYRRLADRAGSWIARIADGKGGFLPREKIGIADDLESANGADILSFEQASAKARNLTRAQSEQPQTKLTVAQALAEYEASNPERDPRNVRRVEHHLQGSPLLAKEVTALTVQELKQWRDSIVLEAAPATVNRTIRILKAALNEAAENHHEQITNANIWKVGLKPKEENGTRARLALSEKEVRELVAKAHEIHPDFGLFVEVGAVTGARPSQIVKLKVQDLQGDWLSIPPSKKGKGKKKGPVLVPISASLAAKLREAAGDRPSSDILVRWINGAAWSKEPHNDYDRPFRRAAEAAGLDPDRVTYYSLRHTSITLKLIAGESVTLVAKRHNNSVKIIEQNYSEALDRLADSRKGVLDFDQPAAPPPSAGNVVTFARAS